MSQPAPTRQRKEFVCPGCGERGQAEVEKDTPPGTAAPRLVWVSSGFEIAPARDARRSVVKCERCRTHVMSL